MEEIATKMVEIANRIGKLETNIVTERTAKMDAEQHVQTLTAQLQSFDQKPDKPNASSVGKDDRHESNGRRREGCKASQLECNDDGEPVGNPTSEWDIGKFESTNSSSKSIISG